MLYLPPADRVAPARDAHDRRAPRSTEEVLAGKKALIVDDDVRNIFALQSVSRTAPG